VFISADARPRAGGSQLSRDEALGHLGAALELTKTAGDLGGQHGMDALETKPQADLLKYAKNWEKGTSTDPKNSGGKSPILLGSAPAGIALSSGDDTTVQAASNLDFVAMRHVQMSAGKRMLFHALESIGLFAHKLGMKLIAASGDISVQAQDGLVELIATKVLRLMSVGGPIELDSAEGIILRSGGAFIEIKGGKVTAGGTAGWLGQFASVSWSGPASQDAKMRSFGKSNVKMDEKFRLFNPSGEPAKKMKPPRRPPSSRSWTW
jgi:type VI secretion system secreted protein VgrG